MTPNEKLIHDFIKSWSTLDPDQIANYFADDGVYHNVPLQPVSGKDRIRAFIAAFVKDWSATDWEISKLLGDGPVVVAERIDHISIGTRMIALPCCGVFELSHGKIRLWRDYFDMSMYTRALAG